MRRSKPTTLPLGTISEGTLRPEDLIPAYLSAAEDLKLSRSDRQTVRTIQARLHAVDNGRYHAHDPDNPAGELTYWESCDSEDDLAELIAILETHTPDYAYFGSLEGDSACFGVWPDLDRIAEDNLGADAEVYRSEMTPQEVRTAALHGEANGVMYSATQRQAFNRLWHNRQYSHWLHVNDHGNATLYRRAGNRWIEVWSVV